MPSGFQRVRSGVILVFAFCAGLPATAAGPSLAVNSGPQAVSLCVPLPARLADPKPAAWLLVEQGREGLPAQLLPAMGPDGRPSGTSDLAATLPGRAADKSAAASQTRCLQLQPAEGPAAAGGFEFRDLNDKSLGLFEAGKPLLVYNHGVITGENVPEKDGRKYRACYVHPLYGLHGEVLTDDFPKDHYHHHGLFWAWPHVQIDGHEYDLWTYKDIKQQHVAWLARQAGPEAALLAVENGWFVGDEKVLVERVWLRAYKAAGGARALDVTLVLIPQKTITLWGAPQKSYGGLNIRFAPRDKKDTLITVPSGKTTEDLPETHLEWADLTAHWSDAPQPTGAAIFVPPQHPDYPPTWLTRHYGCLCVGWPGVEPRTFEPGKPIRLDYRVWIHDGPLEPEALGAAYAAYTAAAAAQWTGDDAAARPAPSRARRAHAAPHPGR